MKTIGETIKSLRETRGMTQEELARFADVTFATLNRLENNKANVTVNTANRILDIFGYALTPVKIEELSEEVAR